MRGFNADMEQKDFFEIGSSKYGDLFGKIIFNELPLRNPPSPPFFKGGNYVPPFEKGRSGGILKTSPASKNGRRDHGPTRVSIR